jgi:hypothetical protein
MSFFNNFNLTNTSVGNFFKGAAGNIGSFFSGTTDKVSGFLGVGDSYQGPKIPKSKSIDETFGVSSYQGFKQSNPKLSTVGQRLYRPLPSARYTGGSEVGFNAFDKLKQSSLFKLGKKGYDYFQTTKGQKALARIKSIPESFPTAERVDTSGFGASSITPGFDFARQANRRDAFTNNQLSQAAIEAALANVKIQQTMLAAIKSTTPNIKLSDTKIAVKRRTV